jgi:hypothetical protein
MLCIQLSDEFLVLSQKHLVPGSLSFELILELLSFKFFSEGHVQELVFGHRVLSMIF